MSRIVRDHYPVASLPEDLREGFRMQDRVRVTIDAAADAVEPLTRGHFSRFADRRRATFDTTDDVTAHVRQLRDEWSDRE